MNKIDNILDQLETKIPQSEIINQEISQANVAWHIEHSLLALNGIIDLLANSKPSDYKWSFNFTKIVVLTTKKIPRGRAKSPKVIIPKGNINKDSLLTHLSLTQNKVKELETFSKDCYFTHPYFGDLKFNQAINFLQIHTKHHLDIISDIIKNKSL